MTQSETRSKAVSEVFKAYPVTVFEFFAKAGQGLYIPAYQRPYSWDKSNIERLVEDVSHGFRMLVQQPDTVTFLGTIIAIHDTQHKTISPLVQGQVPARVMTIIDGQQRLSTLLIANTVIHEQLRLGARRLKATVDEESWLQLEVQRQLAELRTTFEFDQGYGDLQYRFYPRMIRAFIDQWSTQAASAKKAKYLSPIAWHLHKYGDYVRETETSPKKFSLQLPVAIDEQQRNVHEAFVDRVKAIQKVLRSLENGGDGEDEGIEVPAWPDVINSTAFQQALSNQAVFPQCVRERLASAESDFHRQLRLLLFSRFLLTRVALTIVEATNEDSAFDLFEALNTTGEPLTAYETFKPKVIQQESLESFESSASHGYLQTVDDYLSDYKKTDDKQDATRNLVVAFALAETGEKLSRHLSDQRRYLRDKYEAVEGGAPKLEFVEHFARCAKFHRYVWPKDSESAPAFAEFDAMVTDVSRLCVDFLRQSNHTITIAPLIRFYSELDAARITGDSARLKDALREFEAAIKAVAAFWSLWRSSRPATESIDSYYRALMQAPPSEVPTDDDACRFLALSRRPGQADVGIAPSADRLRVALRHVLKTFGKVDSKEAYVERAIDQTASKTKAVTRFVLMAALHDSPPDLSHPGLNERGTEGSASLLSFDTWRALQTIEHIAPEKPERESDWDPETYTRAKGELVDTLGNLTLLPHSINSSLSNRSWRSKQFLYGVLCSPTEQGLKELLATASSFGVSEPTSQLLAKKSTYLGQIGALAAVSKSWTADLVEARGRRLAELAWDRLSLWLDWPK